MKEIKSISEAYQKIDFGKTRAALATVVKVRGSSYRSPGARMIITDDGKWVGSISGGCLEGDALRKARQVMQEKKAQTVTYDTREESNQNLGIGLGCNGVIDVLIEPLDPQDSDNAVVLFQKWLTNDQPTAIATIFNSPACGQKFSLSLDGNFKSNIVSIDLQQAIKAEIPKLFSGGKSFIQECKIDSITHEVFYELIQPIIRVIIFGGGFDARPVTQLAKSLGWHVEVTDECVAHIAPVFFPQADKLSLCQRDFIERDFNITPYTACVLMSHNYEYDRDVLKKVLDSPAPYIGILGPRKRFDKMIAEFKKKGIELNKDDLHRIHSPIGLDIGAETPDEIAVSIVAEIQGKFSNRSGGFLKYRNAPIHQRDQQTDQVFRQIFLNEKNTDQRTALNQ